MIFFCVKKCIIYKNKKGNKELIDNITYEGRINNYELL